MDGDRDLLGYDDPELLAALDDYLRRQGWKQAELARRTGVNSSTISDWLKGRYGPGSDALRAVCRAFGVSRSEFWARGERLVAEEKERRAAAEMAQLEEQRDAARFAEALMRLSPAARREVLRLVADRTESEVESA